jgi:hypothetical protein
VIKKTEKKCGRKWKNGKRKTRRMEQQPAVEMCSEVASQGHLEYKAGEPGKQNGDDFFV